MERSAMAFSLTGVGESESETWMFDAPSSELSSRRALFGASGFSKVMVADLVGVPVDSTERWLILPLEDC